MNLVRWEPINELVSLRQAMDRLFEDSFIRPSALVSTFGDAVAPAIDVYETADELVVRATLPGVKPEDLDINVADNTLTIKGESKSEKEVKQENYIRRECRYGSFARSLVLPIGVKADKAEANLENGILTLTIPEAEEVKPQTIKVKAKQIAEAKKVEAKS